MKNYKWNVKTFIRNLIIFIVVIMLIWFGLSYFEIIMKNLDNPPQYSQFNLLVWLTNL